MQPLTPHTNFAHHRLDAYWVALELAMQAQALVEQVPRGYRKLADQLLRSGTAPVSLIGEGANRVHKGNKKLRFSEARGEAGESAATTETLGQLKLVDIQDAINLITTADRLCAMLTSLIKRL